MDIKGRIRGVWSKRSTPSLTLTCNVRILCISNTIKIKYSLTKIMLDTWTLSLMCLIRSMWSHGRCYYVSEISVECRIIVDTLLIKQCVRMWTLFTWFVTFWTQRNADSVNLMTRTEKEKLDFLAQRTDLYRNGEISRLEYLKRLGFRFRARTDVWNVDYFEITTLIRVPSLYERLWCLVIFIKSRFHVF